ncbi:MAG: efflux RND transporter periplasmic adaptor subunit [Chloroflexota bacterium]
MFKRLRNLIILAIVVIAVAVFIRFRSSASTAAATNGIVQETSTVERGEVALSVSATGQIQPLQKVAINFPTNGTVTTINVKEGDHVLKGQTLATLDSQASQDALMIAQGKLLQQQVALNSLTAKPRPADVNFAQASLTLAQAQLYEALHTGTDPNQVKINALSVESAKNQLWQTQLQRDLNDKKKADLQKSPFTAPQASSLPSDRANDKAITSKEYDIQIAQANFADAQSKGGDASSIASAQAAVTSAQVTLDNLNKGGDQDEVAQAQAQVESAQASVDLAKTNLAKTVLVAPFDGVLAKLNVHIGESTPVTSPAAIMLDTHSFYVDIPVDETDVSKVVVNQPTTLTLDALPDAAVNGKVSRIAETGTKSGNSVTYTVRIEIDPAGASLLSSMSATATITTTKVSDVLRVRNRFIRLDRKANKAYVMLLQPEGNYKEAPVTLGLSNDTYSEIKGGLKAGDKIAIVQSLAGPGGPPPNNNG